MTEEKTDHISGAIQDAIVKEELAIPLYTSHIENVLFWSGLSEAKQKKIVEGLKILKRESEGHAIALEEVKKIYLNEKSNA